jgi:hypothetical protein
MPAHLEGLSASILGRRLPVTPDKPLVIKTNTTSREAGQVVISCQDGLYVLKNGSRMPCRVNGTESRETMLANGDEVQIGKDRFKVVIGAVDEHDQVGTQKLSHGAVKAGAGRTVCSVCDAGIDPGKRGWTDGDRHICPRCLAKGVKPDHLPRPANHEGDEQRVVAPRAEAAERTPAPPKPAATGTRQPDASDRTPMPTPVLPESRRPAPAAVKVEAPAAPAKTAATQPPPAGKSAASSKAPAAPRPAAAMTSSDIVEPTAAAANVPTETHARSSSPSPSAAGPGVAGSSESDRMRHSRRISASRLTAVEPASGREGLFSKVGRVFGRRDERFQRLEDLENDRIRLLAEAGRHALGSGGGLGLPESALNALLQGHGVTVRAEDLSTTDLERWRSQHQRMGLLDAEISALRRSLGLGQDPGSQLQPAPDLRPDQKHQQERAFATLDGMSTDELGGGIETRAPAAGVEAPLASASARQRATRRRR